MILLSLGSVAIKKNWPLLPLIQGSPWKKKGFFSDSFYVVFHLYLSIEILKVQWLFLFIIKFDFIKSRFLIYSVQFVSFYFVRCWIHDFVLLLILFIYLLLIVLFILRQALSLRLEQMMQSHCNEALNLLKSSAAKFPDSLPGMQQVL